MSSPGETTLPRPTESTRALGAGLAGTRVRRERRPDPRGDGPRLVALRTATARRRRHDLPARNHPRSLRFGYGASHLRGGPQRPSARLLLRPALPSFAVSDFQHVVTFAVMFVVAVVISRLTRRVREQADAARYRERRTASLYAMSRELAGTRATANLSRVRRAPPSRGVRREGRAPLEAPTVGSTNAAVGDLAFAPDEKERGVVDWVFSHDKPAGLATDTLPSASALYVPLAGRTGPRRRPGGPAQRSTPVRSNPEQRTLLDVFATQIASALERARLAEQAQQATAASGGRAHCAALSSAPSRTTCALRCPSSRARRARFSNRMRRSRQRHDATSRRRFTKRPSD